VRLIVTTSDSAAAEQTAKSEGAARVQAASALLHDAAAVDCFAILKSRVSKSMMVEFPAMEDSTMLQHVLALNGRTVTESQYQVLLQVIRRFARQQMPIVASVLALMFVNWPSFVPIPSSIASSDGDDYENAFFDCRSLSALCGRLFKLFEQRHGKHLVRAALAFISLARFGVSESELFELLSLSDDVLAEVYANKSPAAHSNTRT
jgi:hypothetical protein